jgi:hypothetical protein
MGNLREAGAIGLYSIAATYFFYFAFVAIGVLVVFVPRGETSFVEMLMLMGLLASWENPVLPPPSWPLATLIGVICGLTWLSGPFWCRRCGRRRHGEPAFYDRPENFARRCRLLGGVAGIPASLAVFAYYTIVPTIPAIAAVHGYWIFRALGRIGPAAELMVQSPRFVVYYFIKGGVFLAFLVAPFIGSAAIGAACGWFYGRHVRPLIARLLPRAPRAPAG